MNIRVKLTRSENYNHFNVSANTVKSMDMEVYLQSVVPAEMGAAWPAAALQAQAIAARTYATWKVRSRSGYSFDVDDTTANQAFRMSTVDSRSTAAVNATSTQILTYNGSAAQTVFSASNGGTTVSSQAKWGNYFPYLIAKTDAWDKAAGYAKNGHGVGMSQRGAQYAANSGRTCNEILTFYYPGTSLISNYGSGGGVQPPVPGGSTRYVNVPVGQTVNIREGAGTTFGILYTWPRGTKCYAETPSATWSAVTRDDGQSGFVMTQYLSATNPNGGGSGYADWQSKYGNNTFVVSNTFSGNVQRYQTDLNLWLRANGYATIATDGLYGSGTMAATRSFQAAYGLAVDGYAGPITKALLFPMYN